MENQLLQLGVGGLFALFILREVFSFLKEKTRCQGNKTIDNMAKQINDLHEWHNVIDVDGVKVWYVRRSLEGAIEKLTNTLDTQTLLLRELVTSLQETRRDIEETRRDVDDLIRQGKGKQKRKII